MLTATPHAKSAPLYRQIEAQLRARIENGEFQPGDRLPSITELRRHFGGVNHLTVRQALKRLTVDGLLRAEQGRGTFVQSPSRRPRRAALVLPHLGDQCFLLVARGVQNVLSAAGVKTLILNSFSSRNEEFETLAQLDELALDGAIIFPLAGSDLTPHTRRYKSNDFPCVLTGDVAQDFDVPCVVSADHETLGEQSARVLLDLMGSRPLSPVGQLAG